MSPLIALPMNDRLHSSHPCWKPAAIAVIAALLPYSTTFARNGDLENVELPVQNYAVIDLSGTVQGSNNVNLIALGDDNKVAFGYQLNGSGDSDGQFHVYTWKDGQATAKDPLDLTKKEMVQLTGESEPHEETYHYKPGFLTPSGEVIGDKVGRSDDEYWKGFSAIGNAITEFGFPSPYVICDLSANGGNQGKGRVLAVASDGSKAVEGYYDYPDSYHSSTITGSESWRAGFIQYKEGSAAFDTVTHFYQVDPIPNAPHLKVNPDEFFLPTAINKNGWGIGVGYVNADINGSVYVAGFNRKLRPDASIENQIWDSQLMHTLTSEHDTPADLNDQNQVVVQGFDDQSQPTEGYLWESGTPLPFVSVLATMVKQQFAHIQPFSISNQFDPATDKTFRILSDTQDKGHPNADGTPSIQKILWTRANALAWTAARIQLPQGTTITDWNTINKNGLIAALGTPVGATTTHALLLLPVEILDKEKKAVNKLKVAKMSETGVLSGAEASATLDIEKDSDRFYIRIPGGAALGGISVKVSTSDNPDSGYNDDAAQIDLQTEGNDAISKSMLLVSDDVDDDHPVDGVGDDATNDRTHKIQLGGNFKLEGIKVGSAAWQTMDSKTPVPVEKTVTLNVVIVRNKAQAAGGAPVIAQATVDAEMKEVNERFAQAGIKVTSAIVTADPPTGVNLADGLTEFTSEATPTAEEVALITGLGTAATNDIHLFYVNHFAPPPGSFGEAFLESLSGAPTGENIIAAATSTVHFNVAHELGHILKDGGGHPSNTYQLMRGRTSAANVLGGSKRFTEAEVTKMKGSKHAK